MLAWAPAVVAWGVRLLGLTLSIRRDERAVEPLWQARAPGISAGWRGRILVLPFLYGRRAVCVLAGRWRDGELGRGSVGRVGIVTVRGTGYRFEDVPA